MISSDGSPARFSPAWVVDWMKTPTGRKTVRYAAVSVVSTAIAQIVFLLSFGVLALASGVWCQFLAAVISALPSYYLNRRWVWGQSGPSHLWREVVPFWVIAVVGLVISLAAVALATTISGHYRMDHLLTTAFADFMALASYGVVWLGKFWIFNRYLFLDRPVGEPA
jgi:putative flippase GtrA